MTRTLAALCTVLLLAACTIGTGGGTTNDNANGTPMTTNDTGSIVWDFRTPLTTIDLGSQFDEVLNLEGPLELEVTFPSGRTLTGTWDRGAFAFAQGSAILGDKPAQPVNKVSLIEDEADNVEAVRASAERFIAEFGPATRGRDDMSITDYLDEFEAIVAADDGTIVPNNHGDGPNRNGSTIRAFVAAEQDGITPAWLARVVDGGVTLRTVIDFEPAPNP